MDEADGQMTDLQNPDEKSQAPSDFFVAGGTLLPDVRSYVKRPADDELFNLTLAGEFCYVLTTRQMGKSSLMIRTAHRLQDKGIRTAIIDLTEAGITKSVDTWYLDLLTELADQLDLSEDVETWWQAHSSLGQVRRFVNFMRDVVLAEVEKRTVIFIDEIDKTLRLDFRDDFFAAIRAMYNARASRPEFKRLTFVLLGVASPPDLIKDPALTPFNIGQGIELEEFSQADAAVLRDGLEAVYPDQGEAIFAHIYHWTSGHPYLTQKLCLAVTEAGNGHWTNERVDELANRLFLSEEARKEANLKFVQDKVLAHPQRRRLFKLYGEVLEGKEIREDGQSLVQNHLKLSGLIKTENEYLHVRNRIYRHVFDLDWIKENTPFNWTLALTGIAGVAVLVALLAVGSIIYNGWVDMQVQDAVASFYQTNTPRERLTHLAEIFRARPLLGSADYDFRARELFFSLSREEQLALFPNYSVKNSDLIIVVKGLYITLADVDATDSTSPLLEAMARALGQLDQTEETTRLRNEIESWLGGRELVEQSQYREALGAYTTAVELNGENPATRYERARIFIELAEYQQALIDLDQAIAVAGRASEPGRTPTPSPPTDIQEPRIFTTAGGSAPLDDTSLNQSPTSGASTFPTGTYPVSVTATPTSLPAATEVPMSTPTLVPDSFNSEFKTFGQIRSAVRNLIDSNRDLVTFLVNASSSDYPNLQESGLISLYTDEGYWSVNQADFCQSYRQAPNQAAQLPTVYIDLYHFSDCYFPSGFMPKKEQYNTTVDMEWRQNPHSGETCMRVTYSAVPGDWEGVYLQHPLDNWGTKPGLDLSRASALTFWAKGERGGEQVEFKIGGIEGELFHDSLEATLGTITLEAEWRQYTIDLSQLNRSSVIGALGWLIVAQNNPTGATFYLDDIEFVEESSEFRTSAPSSSSAVTFCNSGFDDGFECWQHGGELEQAIECDEGGCFAVLGSPDYECLGGVPVGEAWVKQSFQVPQTVMPILSLRYRIFSNDLNSFDSLQVSINDERVVQFGNTDWDAPSCSREVWDSGWQSMKLGMSVYRGQFVEVSIHNVNGTEPFYNTWTYIDDIQVLADAPLSTPSPTPMSTRSIVVSPPVLAIADVIGCDVTFRWSWAGTLADDEWFAVRVGTDEPRSVEWVKGREYTYSLSDPGEYSWDVAIYRGDPAEGNILDVLSVSERGDFLFDGCPTLSPEQLTPMPAQTRTPATELSSTPAPDCRDVRVAYLELDLATGTGQRKDPDQRGVVILTPDEIGNLAALSGRAILTGTNADDCACAWEGWTNRTGEWEPIGSIDCNFSIQISDVVVVVYLKLELGGEYHLFTLRVQ
jgi:tetratricopeptide (TPR) repeat protein